MSWWFGALRKTSQPDLCWPAGNHAASSTAQCPTEETESDEVIYYFFLCVLCRSAPKHLFWFVLLTRVFVSPSFSSVAACSNSCSLSCSNSASHWLIAPALVSHWLTVSNSSPSTRTESVRSKPETHIDKSAFSICTNTTHTNCDAKRHWCGWD